MNPLSGDRVTNVQSWTFAVPTALGRTTSTYTVSDAGLRFESDDVLGGSTTLTWETVHAGGTAAMAGLGGAGAPDFPDWVPARIEWLVMSCTAGSGQAFMRALPQGSDRESIVAALKARLGARWVGEGLPLQELQARLGVTPTTWSKLKVIGIVVAVLVLLALLIMLLALLLHPVFSVPAGLALAGWIGRRGLAGVGHANVAAKMPTSAIARATAGLVVLQGRAIGVSATAAGISGRPCVWWDVTLWAWSADGSNGGEWRQLASRSAGAIDVIELDDDSARIAVWLHDADLHLEAHSWDSQKDTLPAHGVAFLASLGFGWGTGQALRVTESGLELNAPTYVLGTLAERRDLHLPPAPTGWQKIAEQIRTGEWRQPLIRAVPASARVVVAVLIGYLDMLLRLGHGRDRVRRASDARLPDLAPTGRVVWRGRDGHAFVVSDRPASGAVAALRKRSLVQCAIAVAILAFTLYSLAEYVVAR
ncbi:hypothetical protein [Methylibium sp.]|uniref:hypothetical protein n=1 Tax=Methylibium sp. TaxID=2067992 RepID=UPI00286D48F0|nr:hypothetical protein [Methylibium sp.]